MGEIFANPLTELAEYGDMKQDLMKGKGPVQICGVTDSQKVHVMYQVSEEKAWRLVVTHDDTRARELYDDFSYFEKNTWLYPARDLLFYSSDIHGNLLTRQRMQVFKHLMEDVGGTVVTTVDGLMDHVKGGCPGLCSEKVAAPTLKGITFFKEFRNPFTTGAHANFAKEKY